LGDLNHTATPVARFGCSDCKCATHLYHFLQQPSFHIFAKWVQPLAPDTGKMVNIFLK
jgi:Uri superfamily endonuclease